MLSNCPEDIGPSRITGSHDWLSKVKRRADYHTSGSDDDDMCGTVRGTPSLFDNYWHMNVNRRWNKYMK
jgi:hypothetical protein